MLIAHIADMHLTEKRDASQSNLDEQTDIMQSIAREAALEGAKLYLVCGDVFDSVSTPAERNAAIDIFDYMASYAPVVIIRGNHDVAGDLNYLRGRHTKNNIIIIDTFSSEPLDVLLLDYGKIRILPFPWPTKAAIVRQMGNGTIDNINKAAKACLDAILQGFSVLCNQADMPCVFAGHIELSDALMDNDQPLAGKSDIQINKYDLLDIGADYYALGHIHKHQIIDDQICYAGSPRQTSFGDSLHNKGYCLVDVKSGELPEIQHVPSKAHSLITWDLKWNPHKDKFVGADGSVFDPNTKIGNAAIRIKYSVDESEREKAKIEAKRIARLCMGNGARFVKEDPKINMIYRVRSEKIRTAKTTRDRLESYWEVSGQPTRTDKILEKVEILERETI